MGREFKGEMKMVEIKEIRQYGMKMDAPAFKALRQLLGEGLTVTEAVTPAMEELAAQFQIEIPKSPAEKLVAQVERG